MGGSVFVTYWVSDLEQVTEPSVFPLHGNDSHSDDFPGLFESSNVCKVFRTIRGT